VHPVQHALQDRQHRDKLIRRHVAETDFTHGLGDLTAGIDGSGGSSRHLDITRKTLVRPTRHEVVGPMRSMAHRFAGDPWPGPQGCSGTPAPSVTPATSASSLFTPNGCRLSE
jgi:hypothetical protein